MVEQVVVVLLLLLLHTHVDSDASPPIPGCCGGVSARTYAGSISQLDCTSHVTRHTSHVTRHTSHVTRHA